MVSQKIYPSYTNNYYYNSGDNYITLKRTTSVYGGQPIYKTTLEFDTPEEAEEYFNNNCGA